MCACRLTGVTWMCVQIMGPAGSPYAGGHFFLSIIAPDYPMRPPKFRFITEIFHPNISLIDGSICMDVLSDMWSPAFLLTKVLHGVRSLLATPEADDPRNMEAALVYKTDYRRFSQVARKFTEEHAKSTEVPDSFCFRCMLILLARMPSMGRFLPMLNWHTGSLP